MTDQNSDRATSEALDEASFQIADLEDEIRADRLLGELLRDFLQYRITRHDDDAEDAGRLARGADYFLREFIIGDRRENIYRIPAERIRQFAGNWYIVRNLEPNPVELGDILDGVAAFYAWLESDNRCSSQLSGSIARACGDRDFYRERIDSFWDIEGDGYSRWAAACPLPTD
ncbi:hypothetical protein [Geothermobacter hydrogeniphilus]|uniref:Uncharacterized protein n=1 Tax=Geothermobacter hydrogeniphilus TaxID=1969733 RepID=A0A1X0YE71_9BACT|nr:hypothetical protein [Geothermobacter hydrogeniphilus]ORJ63436.1 hypothetical protein B5V00_00815 [Geothermobacter hydrogeniphilus]